MRNPKKKRRTTSPQLKSFRWLWSNWYKENRDYDGRIADLGPAFGPSGFDLITIQKKRTFNTVFLRYALLTLMLIIITGLVVAFILSTITFRGLGRIIIDHGATIASIAMIFLTIGLLIVTRRYTITTVSMLTEMRETRKYESEPHLAIYVHPRLQKPQHEDAVDDLQTQILIRNVSNAPVIDPSLYFDHQTPVQMEGIPGPSRTSSVSAIGTPHEVTVLQPGSEATVIWGCSRRECLEYSKIEDTEAPFVTLRVRFRDSYARILTITQDYGLSGSNSENPHIYLQSEFVSTPTGTRWRGPYDRLSRQAGAVGVSIVLRKPKPTWKQQIKEMIHRRRHTEG